ncbi:MAG: hypothetical protein FJ304_00120 [Planctomycetes bacterium]|nr:hypothetical protein [Planctomycetota bacterium]
MRAVSASNPCPVCKKPDWCLVAPDGSAAICQRVESAKKCGEAGWLHRLDGSAPNPSAKKKPSGAGTDWRARAAKFAANLDADRRHKLAAELKLSADALDALPLLGFNPDESHGACYTFAECDAAGNVVGLLRRWGKRVSIKGGKPTNKARIGKQGLTLPTGWRERSGAVFPVEGPTDTAALTAAGLAAVGRPSNSGGAALLAELFRDLDAGREIIIVGENDRKDSGEWPGRTGAISVATALAKALRRPVRWALPPESAKDVRDWLTDPARAAVPWNQRGDELRALLTANAVTVEPPDEPLADPKNVAPQIVIGTDEYRVNAEAIRALARDPDLYQRGGMLVHVTEAQTEDDSSALIRRPDAMPVIRELPNPLLRERLTWCAAWMQWRGSGGDAKLVSAHPPDWCVAAVGARKDWSSVRRLEAVVPHPVLLPDGKILAASGYDRGSRLLVCLPGDLKITVPEKPTSADVAAAVNVLSDVVSDFPFQSPAHRSAWFAGLLTPLAWFAFSGPAPLFLMDANVRAAGKGLLADVLALTVTGRRFPVMSYTSDRDELRKRITTLAVEGDRMVLLDNLAGAVGNDVFDAALTADRWKDRLLGGNRVYDGPLHVTWFATGNNVQLHGDTSRRVCHCRMESPDERPEMKTGFKYPDLRAHVRANRGALLSAALTILRGWVVAGKPTHGLTPWGSFEGWSAVVREVLVFAGLPDPGETRLALQSAADCEALAMSALLDTLERMDSECRGVTTGEIIDAIRKPADPPPAWLPDLRAAVEELCGKVDSRALGYRFRHFARRNFNGRMIDRKQTVSADNSVRWYVRSAVPADQPQPSPASPASPASPGGGTVPSGDAGDAGDGITPNEKARTRFSNDDRPHEFRDTGDR